MSNFIDEILCENQILKQILKQKEEDLCFIREESNKVLVELKRLKEENSKLQNKHWILGKDCDDYVEKMSSKVANLKKRIREPDDEVGD